MLTGEFGQTILNKREIEGFRAIDSDRLRFTKHILPSPLARIRVSDVRPTDVAEFARQLSQTVSARNGDPIAHGTVLRIYALLSAIFTEAVHLGLRDYNPCRDVRPRKMDLFKSDRVGNPLSMAEQDIIRRDYSPQGLIVRVAMGTGMRQGEQWNLPLTDVFPQDGPYVKVRFGSRNRPPKNGKSRLLPLFGDALVAMRAWMDILPTYATENQFGLAFPTKTGCRRPKGAFEGTSRGFRDYLANLGIAPRRWHDLRHTCFTSLARGWWGEKKTAEQIMPFAGHSTIEMSLRYIELDASVIL